MKGNLRVVSYNIHKGLSPLGIKKTLQDIKYLLELSNADIICLQEVSSRFLPRSEEKKFETQLEFLADKIWPHSSYIKNASYPSGHHGNAILSRWPIQKIKDLDLSVNLLEKRGLLHVAMTNENGFVIHVMCTHLNLLGYYRKMQVKFIKNYISKTIGSDEVLILSGDFNDWREKITFDGLLDEAFKTVSNNFGKSFPSVWPLLSLDRVYYRNLKVQSAEVIKTSRLIHSSDHLPLGVNFQLFDVL